MFWRTPAGGPRIGLRSWTLKFKFGKAVFVYKIFKREQGVTLEEIDF